MPTLYMINAHNSTLASSEINDTVNLANGFTESRALRGSFAIGVPFDIGLQSVPTDLTDLITKKYAGMLAAYPGYENILFDEQIDANGWSFPPATGSARCTVGERQNTSLSTGGTIESATTALGSTPAAVIVRWEAFVYGYSDTVGRTYTEADPALFNVFVSFNNGSTWNNVTNRIFYSIPLADQGSNFKIRFQRNAGATKVHLGSWAIVY
jgi:hypothetical protein